MTELNIDHLLDFTIDAMDFRFMIGDVKDFLEFSEQNIAWQHRRELQSIGLRADLKNEPDFRDSLEQSADHRFQVSLPLRVRYSALLSFVTSVEWSVEYLNRTAKEPVPKKNGDKLNHTVRVLRKLVTRVGLDATEEVADYEALVQLRNCIVHSGGIVSSYEYKKDLPIAAARVPGFTLEDCHFFGPQVGIARGALDRPIERTEKLVLKLHKEMRKQGFQK